MSNSKVSQRKSRSQKSGDGPRCIDRLVLHLVLTRHWFDETERGEKSVEYRKMSDQWRRLIWDRRDELTHVRFSRAYSKTTLTFPVERIDIGTCPIPGWDEDYFRIHFLQNDQGEGRAESGPSVTRKDKQ